MVFVWPENENELTVGYVGISPNNPNHMVFAVTNSSQRFIRFSADGEMKRIGSFGSLSNTFSSVWLGVPSHSTRMFDRVAQTEGEWRIVVSYPRSSPNSFAWRTRRKLATFAYKHHFPWIGRSIGLEPAAIRANGPEMLGNKPAPPAQ